VGSDSDNPTRIQKLLNHQLFGQILRADCFKSSEILGTITKSVYFGHTVHYSHFYLTNSRIQAPSTCIEQWENIKVPQMNPPATLNPLLVMGNMSNQTSLNNCLGQRMTLQRHTNSSPKWRSWTISRFSSGRKIRLM